MKNLQKLVDVFESCGNIDTQANEKVNDMINKDGFEGFTHVVLPTPVKEHVEQMIAKHVLQIVHGLSDSKIQMYQTFKKLKYAVGYGAVNESLSLTNLYYECMKDIHEGKIDYISLNKNSQLRENIRFASNQALANVLGLAHYGDLEAFNIAVLDVQESILEGRANKAVSELEKFKVYRNSI